MYLHNLAWHCIALFYFTSHTRKFHDITDARRDKETDRQTDRPAGRQADGQTHRWADRQTDSLPASLLACLAGWQAGRHTDRQRAMIDKQTDRLSWNAWHTVHALLTLQPLIQTINTVQALHAGQTLHTFPTLQAAQIFPHYMQYRHYLTWHCVAIHNIPYHAIPKNTVPIHAEPYHTIPLQYHRTTTAIQLPSLHYTRFHRITLTHAYTHARIHTYNTFGTLHCSALDFVHTHHITSHCIAYITLYDIAVHTP